MNYQTIQNVFGQRISKCHKHFSATPARELDPAFEYMDELRTVEELNEVLADRHRVKMNSLMGKFYNVLSS